MKFKIEDINNLSDSRQVLESKPNKFITIFIYILLALILMFIAWAWFSEKEVVVNVSGVVRPNSQVQTISNIVQGEVKNVKLKNGEKVSKGDVLFEIDSDSLEKEKERIDDQIDKINEDISNLNKLNKSIDNNTNYFSNSGSEKEYYYKFKSYESGDDVSLSEKNNIANSKNELSGEKAKLDKLSKSIIEETNYNEKNSTYSAQYESYMSSKQMIQNKIDQLNNSKNELSKQLESDNKKISEIPKNDAKQLDLIKVSLDEKQQQISQIDFEIKNSNEELEKLKNDTVAQIKGAIQEASQSINTLDGNLKSIDEKSSINKENNKTTILAQIEEKINLNKQSKMELEGNKKQVEESLEKCVIKSPVNGKVNTLLDLQKGLVLQPGTIVANIIPNSNNYKIELMIPTKDIANINTDKKIKYSFEALPYREYGFLEGNIESTSPDSKTDSKTGISYFTGEGSLNSTMLHSNKGEESYIKPGMICEAKIITRNEKMMYYILEKIGLKNK